MGLVLIDKENSLPSMFKMNAGYFLVQIASEADKEKVYRNPNKHVVFWANTEVGVQTLRRTFPRRRRWRSTGKTDPSHVIRLYS